jgi:EamA-like transporter family.
MIALVFLMHALLAVIFPVGRAALLITTPVFFTGVRMTIAGVILIMYHLFLYKKFSPKLYQAVVPLILFAITGIYLTNVPEFWALQFVPAAKASFIYSLSPFVAALFSYIMFREILTVKKIFGMGIGILGVLFMLIYDAPEEIGYRDLGFISWGEMALIVASIATAYGWIIMRRIVREKLCGPIEATGITMVVGGILALFHSMLVESWSPLPIANYLFFSLYLFLAVSCSSVVGYALYGYLLGKYTTTFLSFAGFIEPLCAAFFAWIFLGELITWRFVAASGLVFVGLYIFYMEELKQGYIVKS